MIPHRCLFVGIFCIALFPTGQICDVVPGPKTSIIEYIDLNSTIPVSDVSNKSQGDGQNRTDYLKTMISVVKMSNFRPKIKNADRIIEHVFMMSLRPNKSYVNKWSNSFVNKWNNSFAWNNTANATDAPQSSTTLEKIPGDLKPIVESRRFQNSKNKKKFLQKRCRFSWQSINEIADETINQFDDPRYRKLRKYRLTASTFGIILTAIRRDSYPRSLFKKLLGEYNLEKIKAIRWGKFHEASALETLRRLHPSWNIRRAGLYLHKSGLLGASPDAITDECVIEIKCPYRFRREKNLEDSLLPQNKYIIIRADDGSYHVNPNHVYYDQVQAEILFSKRQYALLYIWTPNEAIAFKIEKDESWAKNIDLILDFYMNKFIPYVLNQRCNVTQVNEIKISAK